MARRYLAAYGPASVDQFANWWGVTPKAVRAVLATGDGFSEVDVEGKKKAWTVTPDRAVGDGAAPDGDGRPVVRLLPLFDPYTVAVRRGGDRPLTPPEKDLVYRKAGWISPVLLVDGELAGVWEHTEGKAGLGVDIRPFAPLDPLVADRAAAEAQRLADHLGATRSVTFPAGSAGFEAGHGRKDPS